MLRPSRALLVAGLVALVTAQPLVAQTTLLVNTRSPYYVGGLGGLYVNAGPGGGPPGGYGFVNTTNDLYAAFGASNITQQFGVDIGPSLLTYDRLWIDFRADQSTLSAAELGLLTTFIASGRRMVFIGENSGWTNWNQSFLTLVGGTDVPACAFTNSATVYAHQLTAGVSSTTPACSSSANGGTALFGYNYATLWGAQQNVLTVLDSDVFDDNYGTAADDQRFANNVAVWLATPAVTPTPEPASVMLMVTGLVAIAGIRRRLRPASR
jgi:hypothetical protein